MTAGIIDRLGRYEIIEVLGRGGMGVVYKARDTVMRRVVALKTLSPDLLGNAELRKRFEREAEAAGALQHVNIVTIFDLGEADGIPFIALEFLDGESLEKIIARRATMPLADKLKIVIQFCRGLHFAHAKGVVHRDVKPANFVATTDGNVKVVDFGIVHVATSTMTQTGQGMGTPHYMSPEQLNGEHVDARSDIFSVGVVMYEFFAYKKPFEGPNIGTIITGILTKEVAIPLRQLAPEVPPELEELVNKCLRKVPADRFQSLEEVLLELEPIEQTLKRLRATEIASQAQELLSRGDLCKAQEMCQRALSIDSTHETVRALLSQIRAHIKRQEASVRVRQLMSQAGQLLRSGKPEEAIRDLEELLKLDSRHGEARALLDNAYKQKACEDEAWKALSAAKQAYQEGDLTLAESQLKKVLALDVENPQAASLLGKVQQEQAARGKRYQVREAVWEARRLLTQNKYHAALEKLESIPQEFAGEGEVSELLRTARNDIEMSGKFGPPAIGESPSGSLGATRVLEGLAKRIPDADQVEEAVTPRLTLESAIEPPPVAGQKTGVETSLEEVRRQVAVPAWRRPAFAAPVTLVIVAGVVAIIYSVTRPPKAGLDKNSSLVRNVTPPPSKEETPKGETEPPTGVTKPPEVAAELSVTESREWQRFLSQLGQAVQRKDKGALEGLLNQVQSMAMRKGPLADLARPYVTRVQSAITQIDSQQQVAQNQPTQAPPTQPPLLGNAGVQPAAPPSTGAGPVDGGAPAGPSRQTGTEQEANAKQSQAATVPPVAQRPKIETPTSAPQLQVKPPEPSPQPRPVVTFLAPTSHTALSGAFDPNRPYPPNLLDEGFRLLSHPIPPEVTAAVGTLVTVMLEVDSEGRVIRMSRSIQGSNELCKAVAEAAITGWRFSRPTLNGKTARASATVTVQF